VGSSSQYNINETVIRMWIAKEPVIKVMNLCGGYSKYPELETKLHEWMVIQRGQELQVSHMYTITSTCYCQREED